MSAPQKKPAAAPQKTPAAAESPETQMAGSSGSAGAGSSTDPQPARHFPAEFQGQPMASGKHNVPLSLRHAYVPPVGRDLSGKPIPEEQQLERLWGSAFDALHMGSVWPRLVAWDAAPEKVRKPMSWSGAVPARDAEGMGTGECYVDAGNHQYTCALRLLEVLAIHLGLRGAPLAALGKISNKEKTRNRAGDIVEAVLGQLFEQTPALKEQGDDPDHWVLDPALGPESIQVCAQRLMIVVARVQDAVDVWDWETHRHEDELLWARDVWARCPPGWLEAAQQRLAEPAPERRRSTAGALRAAARDARRAAAFQERLAAKRRQGDR